MPENTWDALVGSRTFDYELHKPRTGGPSRRGVKAYKGYPELMRQTVTFPLESCSLVIHRVRHKIYADFAQETVFRTGQYRLHYCLRGTGWLSGAPGRTACKPGRLFLLTSDGPAYEPCPQPGDFESFFLGFEIEDHVFAQRPVDQIQAVHTVHMPRTYVDLADARRQAFEQLLFELVVVMHDRPPSYAFRAREKLLAVFSLCLEWDMIRMIDLRKENVAGHWHHYLWAEKAKRYLRGHYAEKISVREVGAHVGVDPDYLNQLFRRQTGVTLNQYLAEIRIEKAKGLMSDGFTDVTEIAFETGFQSPSYFSKRFRAATGMSPSQYIGRL